MPKQSAGIMAFRRNTDDEIEVLLVHPGGPFFKNKDRWRMEHT
jgi:predicted NUDIX family NTP pyrophosphohydrolase